MRRHPSDPGPVGLEECLRAREILHGPAIILKDGTNSIPDISIIIHDKDGTRRQPASGARTGSFDVCLGREQFPHRHVEFGRLHRLVQLKTMLGGNGSQRFGRDVAGQDDDRQVRPPTPL